MVVCCGANIFFRVVVRLTTAGHELRQGRLGVIELGLATERHELLFKRFASKSFGYVAVPPKHPLITRSTVSSHPHGAAKMS